MHVSTKARYAVAALADLASLSRDDKNPHSHDNVNASSAHDVPVSLKDVAQRQELPLPYMEQIFVKLRRASLVTSVRGAQGGYTLNRAPNDIRISDIIYAVDGPTQTTRCAKDSHTGCMSSGQRCMTHHLWEDLGRTIDDYFRHTSLRDVLNKTSFYARTLAGKHTREKIASPGYAAVGEGRHAVL